MPNTAIVLTGYLGQDPSLRQTKERPYTQRQAPTRLRIQLPGATYEETLLEIVETDGTVPSRDYAVLSLATHGHQDDEPDTTWHRLICWNADRMEHAAVRHARRGDQVRVTGRPSSFTTRDGRKIDQIEIDRLEILRMTRAPEIP